MSDMDKLEQENICKSGLVKIISFIHAINLVGEGCSVFVDHFWDTSAEVPYIVLVHVASGL